MVSSESPTNTDSSFELIGDSPTNESVSLFKLPFINDNSDGWGPNNQPDKYKDLPYQKFSKADKIGKVCFFFNLNWYEHDCWSFVCLRLRSPIGQFLNTWTRRTTSISLNFQWATLVNTLIIMTKMRVNSL